MERKFTPSMVSLNKREIRERLYDDVRMLAPRARSFGMLAGPVPEEEVGCVRIRFFRPEITAYDLSAGCVAAAEATGIAAVRGNIVYKKVLRSCDFFNLDLCKALSTQKRVIRAAVGQARLALSVFVSTRDGAEGAAEAARAIQRVIECETTRQCERVTHMGTTKKAERVSAVETPNHSERVRRSKTPIESERVTESEIASCKERVTTVETTTFLERVNAGETTSSPERVTAAKTTNLEERVTFDETPKEAERLSDAQRGRVLLLTEIVRSARPNAKLARAYAYKGNEAHMVGALFVFTNREIEELPAFLPVCAEDGHERDFVLRKLGVRQHDRAARLREGARQLRKRIG